MILSVALFKVLFVCTNISCIPIKDLVNSSVSEYGRKMIRLIRVRSTVQIHIGKDAATYGNNPIRGILDYPNQHISWGAHLDTGVAPSPNGQQAG